jgi:hypothetical protein
LLAHAIRRSTSLSPRRERECQPPKSGSILAIDLFRDCGRESVASHADEPEKTGLYIID